MDTILGNLHSRTMSAIRDGLDIRIPPAWPGLELARLLEEHARTKLAGDLLKPESGGRENESS